MASNISTDNAKWYPVYTNPRAEKKAYSALLAKGIEAYLPLHRSLKQWSDRKKWVEEPLIKSYIFVKIADSKQADILMTKGVSRFIYFSGRITAMPESQIDDLKLLLSSAAEFEITEEELQPGEKIVIKGGPLKGLLGEIIDYRSRRQLLIRLESLGCSIVVNVAASLLERF